ncbi:MAG TPA: response regulator [Candidatus Acidoferrum sp.]|nr:response regulator [Candidatus Acidoferrum sp.]
MKKPLILQVEDDPNDVFLFSRAFKKAQVDADLRSIEDGDAFITFLDHLAETGGQPPTLVLLDIKLPRKSGFEVLEWIRAHPQFKRLPVIMLTSSAQPLDVRRAYDLGANAYLVKPMDVDEIVRLLGTIRDFWLTANITPSGEQPVTAEPMRK